MAMVVNRQAGARAAAVKRARDQAFSDAQRQKYSWKRQRTLPSTPIVVVPRSYGNPLTLGETKYFDSWKTVTNVNPVGAAWTSTELDPATANTLFHPVQGDAYFNRDGRKVWIKKMVIKGRLSFSTRTEETTPDTAPIVRLVWYMDKQTNGTQAQGEQVLAFGSPAAGVADNAMHCFQNPENFGRFQILKDKIFTFPALPLSQNSDGTEFAQSGRSIAFKWVKKFTKPILVNFNQTNGGTVADIVDNSFHLIGGYQGSDIGIMYMCRTYFTERV